MLGGGNKKKELVDELAISETRIEKKIDRQSAKNIRAATSTQTKIYRKNLK